MAGKKDKKKSKKETEDPNSRLVCRNRKARHEYEILDELECGIVLRGSEVKSVRDSKISIDEAYARMLDGELYLVGSTINEYPQANLLNHEPKQTRKLLAHKRELHRFAERAEQQGFTLVPLAVYFKRGWVKVQIGLAKGRKVHDKRDKMKKSDAREEMRHEMLKRNQ